tara:strand:+ start:40 stop:645 length:606 start_codon:yes stop_codon:yes gene_type:complete
MVEAFEAAWSLLKARSGMGGEPFIGRSLDTRQRVNNPRQGPITASEATDEIYRQKRLNRDTPYLTSFTNKDGSPTKRRGGQTPAFDKSRFITDMYNMGQSGNPMNQPMGMDPASMSEEDRQFLSLFGDMNQDPFDEPMNEIDHIAMTQGVSPEQAQSMAMADLYSGSQHLRNFATDRLTGMINPAYINREAHGDERRVSYD